MRRPGCLAHAAGERARLPSDGANVTCAGTFAAFAAGFEGPCGGASERANQGMGGRTEEIAFRSCRGFSLGAPACAMLAAIFGPTDRERSSACVHLRSWPENHPC